MVMENLIKCGGRVHGGNGNGTLISKTCQVSCWNTSLVSFLSSSNICYPLISVLCLMMEERDGPGRRGWFPLSMHVHIFRTKLPSPDREGPFSGSNIKVVIDDGRIPA